jgi:hypothetical protein
MAPMSPLRRRMIEDMTVRNQYSGTILPLTGCGRQHRRWEFGRHASRNDVRKNRRDCHARRAGQLGLTGPWRGQAPMYFSITYGVC